MKWPTVKLKSVTSKVGSGATPKGGEAVYNNAGIPLIRSMNVHFDGFRRNGLVYIDEREASLLNHVEIQSDDVLFNITGASIGRVTTAPDDMVGARVNQHVCILRPTDKLRPQFLSYYMRSPDQQALVGSNQIGGTRQAVTKEMLLNWEISLPPLGEQERIVKLLDEAGELRKLRAQADRRTADLAPALFYEMFGDPFTSPKGCSVVRIGEAGRVQLGRQRAPKYQTGKFTRPYIRVANVYEDKIDVSDLLTMDFDERDFVQYRLEEGDILLNEGQSTELVGRPAMWRNEIADCCFQNTLVRFQPDRKKVLPDFALAVFLSYFRRGNFASISSKTSNVAHLGAARFAKMPFPLPPLPRQKEFAARVSDVRAMQAEQAASRRRLDDLFQSMLHRAFQGEL